MRRRGPRSVVVRWGRPRSNATPSSPPIQWQQQGHPENEGDTAAKTAHLILSFHPAWGHFAERYQLQQVAIEHEGKQPGARSLATLIDHARQQDIRVVFVQPQFDRRMAQRVAKAIDGQVIALDPLDPDYPSSLRRVAQAFAQALGQ